MFVAVFSHHRMFPSASDSFVVLVFEPTTEEKSKWMVGGEMIKRGGTKKRKKKRKTKKASLEELYITQLPKLPSSSSYFLFRIKPEARRND